MRKKDNYVLDEKDEKLSCLFADLGMPKNFARTLMYVSQVEECFGKDIERGTDLRQPEVSVAMQELRRRGWVKKRDRKKGGKGRPVHIYKTTMNLSEILKTFEQKKKEEFEGVKKNLSELKTLVEKIGSLS